MCPSCEMVQGTVSFPTKVCEVYHVSLENESGTGIYKPLNSQDWHAHVNLKHHMTWIQCKFLIFFAQPQNWNRKEIYNDIQSTFNGGNYQLLPQLSKEMISFLGPFLLIDSLSILILKTHFYNPPAFISQIIPGVDAIYE